MSFTPPSSNGGAAVDSYAVTAVDTTNPARGGETATGSSSPITVTGLTNGDSYHFTVTATNAAGTGSPSSPSDDVTPATTPDAPIIGSASNVAGVAYGDPPQVTVTWTAGATGGSAIAGYTVSASSGGGTCSSAGTACTITSGLVAGTAYTFSVTATNAAGTSPPSSDSNTVTPATVPQAPAMGTATDASGITFGADPQVAVTWADPTDTGGSAVSLYTVTSSPAGGTCAVADAAATACTITDGLTAGTPYTFTVTATNAAGTSAPSSPSSNVAPATLPSAPTDVAASSVSGVAFDEAPQATVSWSASSDGGAAISGYTVTSSPAGGTCTTFGTFCTITTGLTSGVSYTFTVTATNMAGTTSASAPSTAVTEATVPQAPTIGTAGNVTGVASGSNPQANVTWTDPVANGGSTITGYTVTSSPGGSTCAVSGSTATNCTFTTGLAAGVSYTFTVTATNGAGTSLSSGATSSISPATVPAAPTAVSGANVGGTAYGSAPRVTVSWTPGANGGSPIFSYTVTASPGGGTCTSIGTSCMFTSGLTAGTNYTFTVTAINIAGTSTASTVSPSVTPSTVAQAPTIGTATNVSGIPNGSNPQITVTWTDPVANGGSTITGYTVQSSPFGATCSAPGGRATSCTVTSGLTAGISYAFSVVAVNASGTSSASTASNIVGAATVAAKPTGVTATSNANSQSVVSWTAPSSSGGSAITGYTVTSAPGALTCTSFTTSCTVTGLTNGTSYTFTVTATNAAGTGSPSTASAPATPAKVPGTPTGVTASPGNGSAVVSFTPPSSNGGAAIGSYAVTAVDTTNSARGGETATGSSSPITVMGLTNGDSYTFTVTATNAAGTGAASAPSAPVTPAA